MAGDMARSSADLELPIVFVSLISQAGYVRQDIDAHGRQVTQPNPWRRHNFALEARPSGAASHKDHGCGSASHRHFVLRGVVIASSLSNSSNVIIESRRRGMQTRSRERTGAGGSFNWGAPKRKSETQRPLPHGA